MSYATIAVAVIGAAGTAYSANASKKAAEKANQHVDVSGILDDYDASAVFGTKPKAAEFQNRPYQPIDYGAVQGQTIRDNAASLPDIIKLITAVNAAQRGDSSLRIESFAPGFGESMKTLTNAAKALSGGQLPYSDVLDIVSNRQELGNSLGIAGTNTNATLKDLGLSRLTAQQTGAEMLSRIANLTESIDPISQRARAGEFLLQPGQTVPLKQADAQFGAGYDQMERILKQASLQNKYLLEAAPDPAQRGMFGAEFAAANGQPVDAAGGAGGLAAVNWGQLTSQLIGAYRSSQTGSGGGQQPQAATQQRFNPDSGANYDNWGYSAGDWNAGASGQTGQATQYWDGTY